MNIEIFREYCLSKNGAEEDFPFGTNVLVFKVMGKLFALTDIEKQPPTANLKCNPELAIELRERYSGVRPGYHMNKAHWNTVELEGDISHDKIIELIDHSYGLIVNSLSKPQKAILFENE